MCLAMEKRYKKEQVVGAIRILKNDGTSEDDIIKKIMNNFDVTGDYVRELLAPQKA